MNRCLYCNKPVNRNFVLITDENNRSSHAHEDCYEFKAPQNHPDSPIDNGVDAPLRLRNPQVA